MTNKKSKSSGFGPGTIVAAAIIGPGTVTTASKAGAQFGTSLLWVLLFSLIATFILQEMSARLGLVSRRSLSEAIKQQFSHPLVKLPALFLVFSAITIGAAAYEAGNIAGGVMGLNVLTSGSVPVPALFLGLTAGSLLWFGSYKVIEKFFMLCIGLMSLVFVTTAIISAPSISEIVTGLITFSTPDASAIIIVALVGTTVVPYNLFLHSSAAQEHWENAESLGAARKDSLLAITVTGLISMSIVVCAAAVFPVGVEISSVMEMAKGLEPALGSWAQSFFAIGLFAAGMTSSIAAPLAAAYTCGGIFSWKRNIQSIQYRIVIVAILLIGVSFSMAGFSSSAIIHFAQYTNGLLLPLLACFLVFIMNSKTLLGVYKNSLLSNIGGVLVILVCILLSLKSFGVMGLLLN